MFGVYACALLIVVSENNHMMMVLLGLEIMSASTYSLLGVGCASGGYCASFSLVVLTFAVCEAALGLGLLVAAVRGFGKEKVPSVFFLKF